MEAEPLQPPGADAAPPVRPVEWWLALLPVETALLVALGGFLPLVAAVLLTPPVLAAVRFRRLGSPPRRLPAMLVLLVSALFTRLVVTEVFGGVGVL